MNSPILSVLLLAFHLAQALPTPDLLANETAAISPSYTYGTFSYTALTATRYATPLPSPLVIATPFAPAFSQASTLLPSNITYTTYSLDPAATSLEDDGAYGQSAYAALWANLSYSNEPPFTTTVEPTPVPSSELVFPPKLYHLPGYASDHQDPDALELPPDFIWGAGGSAW